MKRGGLVVLALSGVALSVLISGVLLVYARHEHRTQFRAMQAMIAERDALEVEWGALQLERATTLGYLRIDREARERLGMREPERRDIMFLRLGLPNRLPERSGARAR